MTMQSESPAINIRPNSRVRRDRSRTNSKLKWNNVSTPTDQKALQTPSLKVKDYDPGYALRKIAMMYEKNENKEVASLIGNLSSATLNKIYPDFPIDMFIEGMPQTLGIINALYSRIFTERPRHFPQATLPLGSLVMQIVKLYARSMSKDLPKIKGWETQKQQCKNILKIAGYVDGVSILKMLRHRRRCLERAYDGLGEHGAVEVETSPIGVEKVQNEMMSLLSALLVELDRMSLNCKMTLSKLNRTARTLSKTELEMSPSSTLNRAKIFTFESERLQKNHTAYELPSECNHQHVLHYTTSNIQDRLYKNKAILNVVEPTMNYAQLPKFVSALQERIERDKDLLLTFSQLRKEIITVPSDAKLAPALSHYAQAFSTVINILKDFVPDDPGTPETSSTNEFRSDNELFNSYNKTKESRNSLAMNGFSDEINCLYSSTGSSASKKSAEDEKEILKKKCDQLRHDLHRAQKSIEKLKSREKELTTRLSKQAQRSFDGGSSFEDLNSGGLRPSELSRSYHSLYSDGRLQALDALNNSSNTDDEDVKSKLLFSVMVLSFRSCSNTLEHLRHDLHNMMCISRVVTSDPKLETATLEVKRVFNAYLRKTASSYDLSPNVEEVFNQICNALFDRPGLYQSRALHSYVRECISLSWALIVQSPPLFLEYDAPNFDPLKHDRFHTSDRSSDQIVSYLWPSLLERQSGKCVAKGVVITGV